MRKIMMFITGQNKHGIVLSLTFLLCALPWLFFQLRYAVGGDIAFLSTASQRFLAGQRMVDAYFDNNPPMSYLIFIPAALLNKLGIPLWHAANLYIFTILGVSLAMTAKLLRNWQKLDAAVYWGILASYFIPQTILAQCYFGVKDHLIAIVLFPFLLAQVTLTFQHRISRLEKTAIVIGALLLLLKPQYVLLPLSLLIHRAVRNKRWSVIFDFDFLTLAVSILLYAFVIVTRFHDFLDEGLELILKFHVTQINPRLAANASVLIFPISGALILALMAERNNPSRPLALFSGCLAFIAWLAYVVQMKGYAVHMLPIGSLLMSSLFLTVASHIHAYQKNSFKLAVATVISIFCLGYLLYPPDLGFPTHNSIKETTLARYTREHAGKPGDSFYIESLDTSIVTPLAFYTGIPVASRFSFPWFLNGLRVLNVKGDHGEFIHWRDVFAEYTAEDLSRYKPIFVAFYKGLPPQIDMLHIFKANPAFLREWSHYRKKEVLHINRKDYLGRYANHYEEPETYDIYYRTK